MERYAYIKFNLNLNLFWHKIFRSNLFHSFDKKESLTQSFIIYCEILFEFII